jgi:hypothetical protein
MAIRRLCGDGGNWQGSMVGLRQWLCGDGGNWQGSIVGLRSGLR